MRFDGSRLKHFWGTHGATIKRFAGTVGNDLLRQKTGYSIESLPKPLRAAVRAELGVKKNKRHGEKGGRVSKLQPLGQVRRRKRYR